MTDPTPRPAASVLVVRDAPFEVLMLRRHENSSFVPNAWVFPGGMLEQQDRELAQQLADGSLLASMRIAAVRETFEESGVWLGGTPPRDSDEKRRHLLAGKIAFGELLGETPVDLEQLVWTSRWITPVGIPKRFDTYFFISGVSREAFASAQLTEASEVSWVSPADALEKYRDGGMKMVFPTIRNLEAIAGFHSSRELLESRSGAVVEPILPVLVNGRPTLR